jgi:hypothetical protein
MQVLSENELKKREREKQEALREEKRRHDEIEKEK